MPGAQHDFDYDFARLPTEKDVPGDYSSVAHTLQTGFWILVWYVLSICLTLYNKWLFFTSGLHFPLSITSLHFAMKLAFAHLAMLAMGIPRIPVGFSSRNVRTRIAPTGFATAADVALSNQAFLYITVTYYTIVKTSVPVWILIFSVAYRLTPCRPELVGVLVLVISGISLATFAPKGHSSSVSTESQDLEPASLHRLLGVALASSSVPEGSAPEGRTQMLGVALVLSASICAGFRWACSELLLSSQPPLAPRRLQPAPTGASGVGSGLRVGGMDEDKRTTTSAGEEVEGEYLPYSRLRAARGESTSYVGRGSDHQDEESDSCGIRDQDGCGRRGGGGHSSGLHPLQLMHSTAPWGLLLLLPVALAFEARNLNRPRLRPT